MTCLNDAEIQAVADHEATLEQSGHAASCERCRARVDARRRDIAQLYVLASDPAVPPSLDARVREAIASPSHVRGATALRARQPSRRPLWASAVAVAAAIIIVVFIVLPRVGSPTRLSAAQVIGRSLDKMTAGKGVEILEYELTAGIEGPFRIYQLFDHAHPGRYRIDQYDPDGALHAAVSQDPASRSRSELVSVDGRRYIVRIASLRDPLLSIPEMLQAQIEAVLTMLQATGDQSLAIVDTPQGKQYVIEMPPVSSLGSKAMLDLSSARAVIDASDFKIREFHASGVMLKQPFDVSVKLIRQVTAVSVAPQDFEIAAAPGDIVLDGAASDDPLHDSIDIVLRELGRMKAR